MSTTSTATTAKTAPQSTLAVSDYSIPVTGAVRAGQVYGTQFHPEKSGDTGSADPLGKFSELERARTL